MHTCPNCGQAYYCDQDDTVSADEFECLHACDEADLVEDDDERDDEEKSWA